MMESMSWFYYTDDYHLDRKQSKREIKTCDKERQKLNSTHKTQGILGERGRGTAREWERRSVRGEKVRATQTEK